MFSPNNLKNYFLYAIVLLILMVFQTTCNARSNGVVNILTRYGYLRAPEISAIVKNECGVEISYDEYYHSSECLSRLFPRRIPSDYDIAIFVSPLYDLVKKKMKVKNSNLSEVAKNYNSNIRKHYLSDGYPDNVVYFIISLYGFVWNPNIINISPSDSIPSMFEKAKNNIVIVVNSLWGVWDLIDNDRTLSGELLAEKFKKTIQDADIYITNGYNGLYNADNFAFAFQRSGDAIYAIRNSKNKKLAFLVHPKYSYIAPDLIAELNARPETQCAAKVLASKKVLDIVQKNTYYLSPYGTYKSVNDSIFQDIYRPLLNGLYKIQWKVTANVNPKVNEELRNMWYKIHMLPQVLKNHSVVLRRKSE